jgi:hypothetical protein
LGYWFICSMRYSWPLPGFWNGLKFCCHYLYSTTLSWFYLSSYFFLSLSFWILLS